MSDAFKREVDKGNPPRRDRDGGATRPGRLVRCDRPAESGGSAPMAHDSIFRIFSMTKPIVSVGIMMLVEDGHFVLNDPVAEIHSGVRRAEGRRQNNGKLDLVPVKRQMTVQDLLPHTPRPDLRLHRQRPRPAVLPAVAAAQPQDHQRRTRHHDRRHAADVPARRGMELQPLDRCPRPHHRGRLRQIARRVPDRTHPGAAADGRDRIPHGEAECRPPRRTVRDDPWNGDKVQLFNMLEKPAMESGSGGLVSTTMDYARFCQMLLERRHARRRQDRRPQDARADGLRSPRREREGRLPLMPPATVSASASRSHPPRRRAVPGLARPVLLERHGRHVLLDRSRGGPVHGVHDAGPRPARIYPRTCCGTGVRRGGAKLRSAYCRPPQAQAVRTPGGSPSHSLRRGVLDRRFRGR